ncbi:hypothetical protein [Desulfatibacillum aliphaticivorans]|uniref:hypothetical protein n=1 Tax=Desulfatibacillum aliphaticivorans TaxID=218208 RepID=UPI00040BB937|nr:hypothetical protein [Desulfatibacillum aliphaticivorans]
MLQDKSPVELPVKLVVDYDDALGVDLDQSPADVAVVAINQNCTLMEVGMLVTETCGGATSTPVVKFDKRPTAGSDSGRGDGDLGVLNLSTTSAGKVMYDHAGRGTRLEAGEEIVVQLTTMADGTGAAGHGRPYVKVRRSDEMPANMANMVETA